jgi:eukaryotic-like serine/threonine-protein kinase
MNAGARLPLREANQFHLPHEAASHASTARPAGFPFLLPPLHAGDMGRLGNYRVKELLGSGGTGFVFRAEDVDLCRPVALKVLKPDLTKDMESWQRFLREARLMASIKHRHLVTLYQVGQEENTAFLAMELLQGESLDQWMKVNHPAPLPDILRFGQEIAEGLSVIHRHGIIHRDIKPANLWLSAPDGDIKILDFSLATCSHDDANLTRTGTIMGTPAFMSPEQARGEKVDVQSDLFSLGCVLYCLCTGTKPFRDDNMLAMLSSLALESPTQVHELNQAIPRALSDLITQLLEKNPAHRPSSAEEVQKRLQALASNEPEVPSLWPSQQPTRVVTSPDRSARQVGERLKKLKVAGAMAMVFLGVFVVTFLGIGLSGKATRVPVKGTTAIANGPTRNPVKDTAAVAKEADDEPPPKVEVPPAAVTYQPVPFDLSQILAKLPSGKGFPSAMPPIIMEEFGVIGVQGRILNRGAPGQSQLTPADFDPTHMTYRLGKKFSDLRVEVTLKSDQPSDVAIAFSVLADGKMVWQSPPLTTQASKHSGNIMVKGVDMVKFDVSYSPVFRGKHSIWIDASVGP